MQTLLVSAAVLIEDRKVLITQRKSGTHLGGTWEFPGGKVEASEDPRDALVRELEEELGISVTVHDPIEVTFHRYVEKAVLLLFFIVERTVASPAPAALDVADFRWVTATELDEHEFPPADVAVLEKVRARLRL